MPPPTEKQAEPRIKELLTELLGATAPVQVKYVGHDGKYDFAIVGGNCRFAGEYKSRVSQATLLPALLGLKAHLESSQTGEIPLLIVPYMGPLGQAICERLKIGWLDLCGNANIVAPGLRIWIEGRPNLYRERGRPTNVFAPKSSRIPRQLLLHPRTFQTQTELAQATGLDDGYVSKLVRRLETEEYLDVNRERGVRPRDPALLLDAWRDVYDFQHHRIIKGHVPARTGEELLQRTARLLRDENQTWAVTGLGAAWLYTRFAAFRLGTIYLSVLPSRAILEQLDFVDEPKGANLWFVIPDDDGVFADVQMQEGIPCVSAVQTYLDLKGMPERANEAAAELRRRSLFEEQHEH